MKNKTIWAVGAVVGAGVAAYFGRQFFLSQRSKANTQRVIPDVAGNYDIDGVSFDRGNREVIVSGDATRDNDPKRAALLH